MKKTIKTRIIPITQTFAKVKENHELNFEAIHVFEAIGFCWETDWYWKNEDNYLVKLKPLFKSILLITKFCFRFVILRLKLKIIFLELYNANKFKPKLYL